MGKIMVFGWALVLLLFPVMLWASGAFFEMPTEYGLQRISTENIAVDSGVTHFTALTQAQEDAFREAHIFNSKGDTVRFRVDGTNPTSTIGPTISSACCLVLKSLKDWKSFKAIAESTGSGASLFSVVYGK